MNYLTYSKLKITHFFDKFILQRKSVQQGRPLNIVQSVQNFAHKLIFLCVTRAALWSYAFPTFSFLGHTTAHTPDLVVKSQVNSTSDLDSEWNNYYHF